MFGRPRAFIYYFILYGGLIALLLLGVNYDRGVKGTVLLATIRTVPPLMGFIVKFYALGLVRRELIVVVVLGLLISIIAVLGYFMNYMKLRMVMRVGGLEFTRGGVLIVVFGVYYIVMWMSLI